MFTLSPEELNEEAKLYELLKKEENLKILKINEKNLSNCKLIRQINKTKDSFAVINIIIN